MSLLSRLNIYSEPDIKRFTDIPINAFRVPFTNSYYFLPSGSPFTYFVKACLEEGARARLRASWSLAGPSAQDAQEIKELPEKALDRLRAVW